jgi:hypothetical protein
MDALLEDPIFWRTVMIVLVPVSFWFGFRCWRRARLIGDLPTSRVRSAAQGYVELLGRARLTPGTAVLSPLTRRPCVWWTYQIQERRRSGKSTRWATVDSDTCHTPFLLEDDSGWCVVNPLGAEVFPEDERTWYGSSSWLANVPALATKSWLLGTASDYRYTEHTIAEHEMVNAMGNFRTVGGVQAVDKEAVMAKLLAAWKQDMPALTARFDADHNGVLSQQEWEAARAAARRQVEEHALRETPAEYAVLVKPDDDRPFLLASGNLERLARRYRWKAVAALLLFVALCAVLTAQLSGPG